jgi:uncharacterized protein (DUF1499 family)
MGMSCAANPSDIGLNEGTLRPCSDAPNCVCSEGQDPGIEPLAYVGDGQAAFLSLLDYLELQSNVEVVTIEDGYAHAVYRTPLLRFRDDLELRLDEANSVIQVRSSSRVGYSDMGANRRRVEDLRKNWSSSFEE